VAVVHKVYAEALLGAARDSKRVDAVRKEFAGFVEAVRESDELADLLRNPQIDPRAKRESLESALAQADETFLNFVRLVAEKGRAGELEAIHEEWERLLAAEERILELELTTAVELSDEEATAVVRKIEDASGRKVEASRTVDPDLIGGLVLRAGSVRVDGSVRGRLNSLRDELLTRG
jgi:F-type H+-transporting ATPase subunit delta